MKLTKIKIKNFKSIDELEFDVKKYGQSYTTMFVGINETGKSNILEAMSYFNAPTDDVNFNEINNRNNTKSKNIELCFEIEFENENIYIDELKEKPEISKRLLQSIKIKKVSKYVFLEKEKTVFETRYVNEFEGIVSEDFYSKGTPVSITDIKHESEIIDEDKHQYNTQLDDEKLLGQILNPLLNEVTKKYEFSLTLWKPEPKFLITEPVDLNAFKDDPSLNIPLKNIFALSDFKKDHEIKEKIEGIVGDYGLRRGLASELTSKATEYFEGVWEHKTEIDIEINDNLKCTVNVKDKGEPNKNKFFKMNSRSQGFQQFASLILSLSIQNHSLDMKNNLILIDEPENHLHPSGIRDMKEELLKIGKNNYVFLATHSYFMIDRSDKERNFIIKKDKKQNTIYSQIKEEEDIFDDEVLANAFGINIYKDFLTPHKLLVEGLSDKKILLKAIKKLNPEIQIGISNGYGSNIVAVASRFGLEKIESLVVLDDDPSGRSNKDKIIEIGGIYSTSNVLTIKDIEPNIIEKGTIEDTLGLEFIQTILDSYLEELCSDEDGANLKLVHTKPVIEQIKIYFQNQNHGEDIDNFLEKLKTKISEEFNPSNMESNFPLLKSLVEKIKAKFKGEDEELVPQNTNKLK